MDTGGTGRRTLLQRGLALLAGGVAVAAGARTIHAEQPVALKLDSDAGRMATLTLYARKRPIAGLPGAARGGHTADARTLASGELLASPDGGVIGSLHTNCFCMGTPIGTHNREASNLEFQVLELKDGTLFGLCGGAAASGVKAHAIVGGTGAYAGARGTCVERAVAGHAALRDVVELVVTLAV